MNLTDYQRQIDTAVILLSWALPMAWVISIPDSDIEERIHSPHSSSIEAGERTIGRYIREFGKPPLNLNAIRAYARINQIDFSPWDEFGQRLDYLQVGPNWILRSFGADGVQNTLTSKPDPVTTSTHMRLGSGVQHSFQAATRRYNPILLLGATSVHGSWRAGAYIDGISGASRLLVRHNERKNFFMIADHDTVEEFYWLPDGYRIVFSATGSNRYRDGVYLWNLVTDTISMIYPHRGGAGKEAIGGGSQSKFYDIALAGITPSPTRVLVYAKPRDSLSLDPTEFFAPKHLVSIRIPEKGRPTIESELPKEVSSAFPLHAGWTPRSDIAECIEEKSLQTKWCALPTEGPFQGVLESWQKFAESAVGTPLFPYCLMQLTALYSDSYQLYRLRLKRSPSNAKAKKNADVLRSFGMEFSSALANHYAAPGWLRSVARYSYERLGKGNPLPFRAANLTIGD